jgi:hypothetical protein
MPHWIFCERKFPDDFSADQMFLNDALQNFRALLASMENSATLFP